MGSVDSTEDILCSISIKMMAVLQIAGKWRAERRSGRPLLIEPDSIAELSQKVGDGFAAHPDPNEILAEAFVQMALGEQGASPIDLAELKAIMQKSS